MLGKNLIMRKMKNRMKLEKMNEGKRKKVTVCRCVHANTCLAGVAQT